MQARKTLKFTHRHLRQLIYSSASGTQKTNVRFSPSQQGQSRLCTVAANPDAGQGTTSFPGRSKEDQGPKFPSLDQVDQKEAFRAKQIKKSVLGLFSSGNSEFHYSNRKTAFEPKLSHELHILLFP